MTDRLNATSFLSNPGLYIHIYICTGALYPYIYVYIYVYRAPGYSGSMRRGSSHGIVNRGHTEERRGEGRGHASSTFTIYIGEGSFHAVL